MQGTGRNGDYYPISTELDLTISNAFASKIFKWDKLDVETLRDEFLRGKYILDFRPKTLHDNDNIDTACDGLNPYGGWFGGWSGGSA